MTTTHLYIDQQEREDDDDDDNEDVDALVV